MPDLLVNVLPPTAGGDVEPSSELDVGECFAPFIPQVAVTPASTPKPKPAARVSGLEKVLRELGFGNTSTDAGPETELLAFAKLRLPMGGLIRYKQLQAYCDGCLSRGPQGIYPRTVAAAVGNNPEQLGNALATLGSGGADRAFGRGTRSNRTGLGYLSESGDGAARARARS